MARVLFVLGFVGIFAGLFVGVWGASAGVLGLQVCGLLAMVTGAASAALGSHFMD